jgi:hypothetical protein
VWKRVWKRKQERRAAEGRGGRKAERRLVTAMLKIVVETRMEWKMGHHTERRLASTIGRGSK